MDVNVLPSIVSLFDLTTLREQSLLSALGEGCWNNDGLTKNITLSWVG